MRRSRARRRRDRSERRSARRYGHHDRSCEHHKEPPDRSAGSGLVMDASGALEGGAPAPDGGSGNPPSGKWINVTNNLAGLPTHAPCGNLSSMCQVPGKDEIIVAVANGGSISPKGGLWSSTDGGASWSHMGTRPGSDLIDNNPYAITFDPENPDIFWESGQYGKWGVYKTIDGGKTFHHLALPAYTSQTSVDFTDPERKTLVVGSVEISNTVWKSSDGGLTWTNIGANLPAGTNFSTDPVVIDANTYLVVCSGWGREPTARTAPKTAEDVDPGLQDCGQLPGAMGFRQKPVLGLGLEQRPHPKHRPRHHVEPNRRLQRGHSQHAYRARRSTIGDGGYRSNSCSFHRTTAHRGRAFWIRYPSSPKPRDGSRSFTIRDPQFVLRLQVGLPDDDAVRCDLAV